MGTQGHAHRILVGKSLGKQLLKERDVGAILKQIFR
jgi:hypothetical protein